MCSLSQRNPRNIKSSWALRIFWMMSHLTNLRKSIIPGQDQLNISKDHRIFSSSQPPSKKDQKTASTLRFLVSTRKVTPSSSLLRTSNSTENRVSRLWPKARVLSRSQVPSTLSANKLRGWLSPLLLSPRKPFHRHPSRSSGKITKKSPPSW